MRFLPLDNLDIAHARQVLDEVRTAFVAGYETTASALFWSFYLLARHPDHERHDARLLRPLAMPRLILPDGSAPEVPFPGSSARVEEDRYEVIASWSRPLSGALSIKLAAGGEYSKLSQFGGGGSDRTSPLDRSMPKNALRSSG